MSKFNNFLNTLGILTSLITLSLCYWARIDFPLYVSGINYFSIFALAATIFCLPDFLCYYFPSENKWYRTSEFYTGLLLLFLCIPGIFLSQHTAWTGIIIIPIGIALGFWQLYQFVRNKNFLLLATGLVFMVFLILLFYSQNSHSFLLSRRIILGKAYIDTLFHSSMNNMFSTAGWPSTGLNGSPFIHYHFGSHILIGGLKNWTGVNTLMFYNIAYPAIFLPLFFKSLFNFLNRLFIFKGTGALNILFAISFMIVMYSLPFPGFRYVQPIPVESFCIAFIFTFLYGSNLLSFISDSRNINLFFFYSLISLLIITFFKVSNGFVCYVGIAYLCLRTNWSLKSLIIVFIAGAIIATFSYLVIFPVKNLLSPASSLLDWISFQVRIIYFWRRSDGFISYLLGALIAIIVMMRYKSLDNWSEIKLMIKTREFIDMEILFVMTVAGFLAGIYASSNPSDVYCFVTVQLFISMPFLLFFVQKQFERFRASGIAKSIFLYLIIAISIASRPDIMQGYNEITQGKKKMAQLNPQQQMMKEFLDELFKLEKERDKETKCIYIPQSEKWYYESQWYRPMGSPLVVPAISGIAMIGGVPDTILNRNYNNYGYSYYKKNRQLMAENINEAKIIALRKGYNLLIEYQFINGKLDKQVFELRK
jgi:hypothetical protein